MKADLFRIICKVDLTGESQWMFAGMAEFDRAVLRAARGGILSALAGAALGKIASIGTVRMTITAITPESETYMAELEVEVGRATALGTREIVSVRESGVWDIEFSRPDFSVAFVMALPYHVVFIHSSGGSGGGAAGGTEDNW